VLTKELVHGYYTHAVATMPDVEVEKVKAALKPVRELYGEIPAAKFGPVAFKAVRVRLVDAGLCISTIRDRLGIIKRMIGWGVENEMLPGDALHRLKAVQPLRAGRDGVKPSRKVRPVSEEHIQAILPHVPALTSPAFRPILGTGKPVRRSERSQECFPGAAGLKSGCFTLNSVRTRRITPLSRNRRIV
jgi:hypothetical protein